MRKILIKTLTIIFLSLFMVIFASCSIPGNRADASLSTVSDNTASADESGTEEMRDEHQFFSKSVLTAENCTEPEMIEKALAQAGLLGLDIVQTAYGVTSNLEDTRFPICILGDYRYGSERVHDAYLAVATPDYVFLYDLSADVDGVVYYYEDTLALGDVNGDGVDEILIHQNTGGVGGAGSYTSWVFQIDDGGLKAIFKSAGGEEQFDTGFRSVLLDGYKLQITNSFTGFDQVYDIKASHAFMFDEAGSSLSNEQIAVDCFYDFDFADTDEDGICEIVCAQYVSLHAHVNQVGVGVSTLKFDTQKQAFVVVAADFSVVS